MAQHAAAETSWLDLVRPAQRHPAARDPLLRRARPFLYALILDRVHRPEVAEDLTQDALTDVACALPHLRDAAAFPAWLRQIALNRCRMYWRRAELAFNTLDEEIPTGQASDAYTLTAQRETWRQLRRALDELPEPSRLALLMHALGDCPYAEIAAALGETEVAVRVRVHRARQRLRQLLPPSFYDPEAKCDE